MTQSNPRPNLALEQQRDDNLRHARDINSFWRERGVEANARVRVRNLCLDLGDGMSKTVRSAEIVSDLPPRMARSLALAG